MRTLLVDCHSEVVPLGQQVEICGKVVYVDVNNKNVSLKVDDGTETIKCCIWTETYQPPQIDYLGKSVILTGKKTQLFQDTILNIIDISTSESTLFTFEFFLVILPSVYEEIQWRLALLSKSAN